MIALKYYKWVVIQIFGRIWNPIMRGISHLCGKFMIKNCNRYHRKYVGGFYTLAETYRLENPDYCRSY